MRFKNLDLNLLAALHSLLNTHNVSRAGEQLHLSQPAMSAALTRLRAYFNDELFVSVGKRMIPTPYAENLAPIVADILGRVEKLVATSAGFDPLNSQRVFRLGASDYITLVLITPLLNRLQTLAPQISLQITTTSDEIVARLEQSEIDLLLAPEEYISSNHPAHLLFLENHVVAGWDKNPIFNQKLSEEAFFSHGHIGVDFGSRREDTFAEKQMGKLGLKRRIEILAPSFLAVPWMLPQTMRLAVMHERLAKAVLPALPLRTAPLPFFLSPMREMLQYHSSREFDAGIRWLISHLFEIAQWS